MNQKQENIFILTIFVVFFIVLMCKNIFNFQKSKNSTSLKMNFDNIVFKKYFYKEEAPLTPKPSPKQDILINWGRDPFKIEWIERIDMKEPEKQMEREEELKLKLIILGEKEKSAVINHKIFHEGDSINGERIVKILKDRVVLEKRGLKRTLFLKKSLIDLQVSEDFKEGK